MSSDTDSDTSADSESSVECKKRKSSKKHKHKSEKKQKKKEKKNKRYKEKKSLKKERIEDPLEDSFGPALPPHLLLQKPRTEIETASKIIGPVMPENFLSADQDQQKESITAHENDDESDDFVFGPLPSDTNSSLNTAQIEREKRALELKIAVMEGRGINPTDAEEKTREEWMLELPEVGLRGGLAALNNMKRTFHQGKEKPDFSDRSSWTKTPQSESNRDSNLLSKTKLNVESLKSKAEATYERERDAEQERLARKHKKKHKREESLVEIHQKKLRKEQKRKEKELAASGSKPERRPFSRDIDLKLNKIDSHQTKQIVDKAKILNSKFSSGKAKYL